MILPANIDMALHIARRMRAVDRHEVFAVSPITHVDRWAEAILELPGPALVLTAADGEPVAMGGGAVVIPDHLASVWFVATDRIDEPNVRVGCHRLFLQFHRDLDRQWQVKRCQALALASNREAGRWLTRLGYQPEGMHPCYGRDGETFQTWGRVA